MNAKFNTACFLCFAALFVLLAVVIQSDSNGAVASPGRGGGGRSGGSSRGSSSRGSSTWGKVKSTFGGSSKSKSYGGSGGVYKKSSTKSKLKKAALIGGGAYAAYQIGKLSGKFSGYSHGGFGRNYGFNDWNNWREIDGFMCRNNNDCNWIDKSLYCQDYELDFQPSALWFGGDVARIVGECACPHGQFFDDDEMQCQVNAFSGIGAIIGLVVAALFGMCCCGCICFMIVRNMM